MCQVSFCGIGVQHRCVAVRLTSAHPHGMSDIGDLIQSTEVYACFDGNAVEVDIMLDYLGTQNISPRHIYGEVNSSLYTRNMFPVCLTRRS
jgi:E3 ubiquitin-protein ligase CHFR